MTPEALAELDRKIAVMQASKTQEIECRNRDSIGSWCYCEGRVMKWNWESCDYRVKPAAPICLSLDRMETGEYYSGKYTFQGRTETSIQFIELTPAIREKLSL